MGLQLTEKKRTTFVTAQMTSVERFDDFASIVIMKFEDFLKRLRKLTKHSPLGQDFRLIVRDFCLRRVFVNMTRFSEV